jgi:hypothetical protein
MKLWNDQGKILGLITPLDLAVIIIIIFIGAKIIGDYRPVSPKRKERPVSFGLLIRNAPPYLLESLVVGQDLFEDTTDAYLGKIRDIRSGPAEVLIFNQGEIHLAQSPRNLDIRLELIKQRGRVETGLARSGVYLGKIPARTGISLRAHTRYTAIQGEIIYIKLGNHK